MDMKLAGKTVLISGGSRGIGFACAMAFAAEGCTVHIASRSKESLETARDKICARHNVPVEIHPADFANGDTVRSVVDAVGHADILVNNAGAIPRGDILGMTEPKWREAELKVFGYINATRAMLEKYARRKGAIVNIIGLAGESFNYDYVTGTMGNASLMAFTRAVGSKSVDQGVRVVAINPPATRTDRMLTLLRGQAEKQLGDPRTVARAHQAPAVRPPGRTRRGRRPRRLPRLRSGELHQRRGDDLDGGRRRDTEARSDADAIPASARCQVLPLTASAARKISRPPTAMLGPYSRRRCDASITERRRRPAPPAIGTRSA